jgi:RNA polymerase sigma-70 factor (ECF subfamily)
MKPAKGLPRRRPKIQNNRGAILLGPRRPAGDLPPARAGTETDLESALTAARAGDEAGFSTVYRALTPGLQRYVRTLVGEAAEDVTADAWLQIARDLGRFSGDLAAFRAWTATIARNRALDHLRRVRVRPDTVEITAAVEPAADDDVPEAALERMSTAHAVSLIASLPKDQAEAVMLRVVVGLDAEAAGRVLGKRAGAVRTAAHRGLTRLARELAVRAETAPPTGVTKIEAAALRTVR